MKWRDSDRPSFRSAIARAAVATAACCWLALAPAPASAAGVRPTLLSARVAIAMIDAEAPTCDVETQYELDLPKATTIEHVLALDDAGTAEQVTVTGAGAHAGASRAIGRTLSLPIAFADGGRQAYAIRYRAISPGSRSGRCPVFLPLAPTDGLRRSVTLQATLPPAARRLPADFPIFEWDAESRGHATLGNLPAFVLVPFARPGETVSWLQRQDPRRVIDIAAVMVLTGASVLWSLARRRMERRRVA